MVYVRSFLMFWIPFYFAHEKSIIVCVCVDVIPSIAVILAFEANLIFWQNVVRFMQACKLHRELNSFARSMLSSEKEREREGEAHKYEVFLFPRKQQNYLQKISFVMLFTQAHTLRYVWIFAIRTTLERLQYMQWQCEFLILKLQSQTVLYSTHQRPYISNLTNVFFPV